MLLYMPYGLNEVGAQLIFFELNYITPWKCHTIDQKDPEQINEFLLT